MFFLLSTPEANKIQSNITKVKVHLRNGIAEIFDQHQDLMGKIDNNLVEIETRGDNKIEKFLYVLQDAVFIVSTQGLEKSLETKETGVYVYAKKGREITSTTSIEEINKLYEQKTAELEKEIQKFEGIQEDKTGKNGVILNSKIMLLKEEVEFFKRVLSLIKAERN